MLGEGLIRSLPAICEVHIKVILAATGEGSIHVATARNQLPEENGCQKCGRTQSLLTGFADRKEKH